MLKFGPQGELYCDRHMTFKRLFCNQEKLKTYGLDPKSPGSKKPWECKEFMRVILNFITQKGIEKMFEAYMKAHKAKVTPEDANKFAQECIVTFAGKK